MQQSNAMRALYLFLALCCLPLAPLNMTHAQSPATPTPHVLYVYDPLCGWCFGFDPVLSDLAEKHPELRIEVIGGGMMTGQRVGPISQMADYILGAYKQLEQTTGVRVGEPYLALLRQGTYISNSEPPCRALAAYKLQRPDDGLRFAIALQDAMFVHGNDLNAPETYANLAESFGLDAKLFLVQMESPEAHAATQQGFAQSQSLGVQGFSSVFYFDRQLYHPIAHGYTRLEQLERSLKYLKAIR